MTKKNNSTNLLLLQIVREKEGKRESSPKAFYVIVVIHMKYCR